MADAPDDTKKKLSLKDRLKGAYNAVAKTGKAVYEDAKKNAGETMDTLSVLVNEKAPVAGEAPKDLTLKQRMNAAVGHVGKTEWLKVVKDTAKDLTTKDELKRLAGTVIALPGGVALYGAYRVAKHRKDKMAEEAANENKAAPVQQPKKTADGAPKP